MLGLRDMLLPPARMLQLLPVRASSRLFVAGWKLLRPSGLCGEMHRQAAHLVGRLRIRWAMLYACKLVFGQLCTHSVVADGMESCGFARQNHCSTGRQIKALPVPDSSCCGPAGADGAADAFASPLRALSFPIVDQNSS